MTEHWIFHPDDTVLKDFAWAHARPAGETHTLIVPKDANFQGEIALAPGEGRNGKNAFKMTATGQETTGDPAFWIAPFVTTGGSHAEPEGDNNFIVPPTKRVNRMELWLRFPPAEWPRDLHATVAGMDWDVSLHLPAHGRQGKALCLLRRLGRSSGRRTERGTT